MKREGFNKDVYRSLALISQFGINMLVPIFLCMFLGIYIDGRLGTSYFTILLFFVGTLAGFTGVYKLAKRIYRKKDHDGKN